MRNLREEVILELDSSRLLYTTPPAFTLLEGGGVTSAQLAMLFGIECLKLGWFGLGSGQPRTDAWFWVYAEVGLSGPNSVNAYVVGWPCNYDLFSSVFL